MELDFAEILKASMVLFAVIDIIGSVPVIVTIKKKAGGTIDSFKASRVSLYIMIAFLFLGEKIIGIFGIQVAEFAVAGALVMFVIALEMILGVSFFKESDATSKSASIVPIAFPLIAGAGSMTSIISLRAEYAQINILIAIIINIIVVYIVLRLTGKIEKLLGEAGIAVLQKVFGIILLAIAIKLFSANAKELFLG